jgi:hypothetical protein
MSKETFEHFNAESLTNANGTSFKKITASMSSPLLSIKDQEQALDPFLKLSPPVSAQSNIEYNQVFKLAPNESFYSLYNRCYRVDHPDDISYAIGSRTSYLQDQIHLIDNRPRRWYQTLKEINNSITELDYNKSVIVNDIKQLKAAIEQFPISDKFGTKQADYSTLNKHYKEALRKQQEFNSAIVNYNQLRSQVIYEISAAGYICQMKDNEVKIIKTVPKMPVKPPLELDDIEVINDDIWQEQLSKLDKALFYNNKLITSPQKINQFKQDSSELSSVDSCSLIQNYRNSIKNDIAITIQEKQNWKQTVDNDTDNVVKKAEANCEAQISKCDTEIGYLTNLINLAKAEARNVWRLYHRSEPNESDLNFIQIVNSQLAKLSAYPLSQLELLIAQYKQLKAQYTVARDNTEKAYQKSIDDKIRDYDSKIAMYQEKLSAYDANVKEVLLKERTKFLHYWNNPEVYDNQQMNEDEVSPDKDSLVEFYDNINKKRVNTSKSYQIHRFSFQGDGYYDEDQTSLREFMESPNLVNQVAIFPYIDKSGQSSPEILHAIEGPRKPGIAATPKIPMVKIIETHELSVSWQQYALGALKSSINLAPGEKKQIVINKQTKITRQINESRSSSSTQQRNVTSSFEDNLTNELSNSRNRSFSDQNSTAYKKDQNNGYKSSSLDQNTSSSNYSADVSADAEFGISLGEFSAEGKASESSSNNQKSSQFQSMEAAIAVSQSENVQTLTNSSRATSTKNLYNRINKVATETSSNNKIDVTSSSSEQYEEDTDNKEMMQLANPNTGRAINYNLYQLQNVYKSQVKLKDVKIVINTGIELVEGSDILDLRVYELEDFNKIYKHTTKTNYETLLCALIARKILKNYTDVMSANPSNEGVLRIKIKPDDNIAIKLTELKLIVDQLDLCIIVNQTDAKTQTSETILKQKIIALQSTLSSLQKYSFELTPNHLISESEHVVNAPAYHMDSQLGRMPATEPYLENQRRLAIETKKANIDNLRAKADFLRNLQPPADLSSSPVKSSTIVFLNNKVKADASTSTEETSLEERIKIDTIVHSMR